MTSKEKRQQTVAIPSKCQRKTIIFSKLILKNNDQNSQSSIITGRPNLVVVLCFVFMFKCRNIKMCLLFSKYLAAQQIINFD
jgi:hypothetical protein